MKNVANDAVFTGFNECYEHYTNVESSRAFQRRSSSVCS